MPAVSSEVATGRRMNVREGFMEESFCHPIINRPFSLGDRSSQQGFRILIRNIMKLIISGHRRFAGRCLGGDHRAGKGSWGRPERGRRLQSGHEALGAPGADPRLYYLAFSLSVRPRATATTSRPPGPRVAA